MRFAGQVSFIADGSFEVFVGRLVVAAFFKAFAKRFALALLGKVMPAAASPDRASRHFLTDPANAGSG
jgi:hypothetical protein